MKARSMRANLNMIKYNCPHCAAELQGMDVDRPTRVRCPIMLIESDRARYPDEVEQACKDINVQVLPYTKRCGKMYMKYPSKEVGS